MAKAKPDFSGLGRVKGFSLLKENPIYSNPKGYLNTGNILLNWAIAGGADRGYPKGKVIEIFGDPSTGKSLLAYQALAEVQRIGGLAILDDVERAFDIDFGKKLGVDTARLMIGNSNTLEECFENLREVLQSCVQQDVKDVAIVIDSIGQLASRHATEIGFDKRDMTSPGVVRLGVKLLAPIIAEGGYTLIVLNHVIANIIDMFHPTTTPSGSGFKFGSAVRIELANRGRIPKDKKLIAKGIITRFYVAKNRIAPPFREGKVDIFFSHGIGPYSGVLDKLLTLGYVEPTKSPRFVSFLDDDDGTRYEKVTFDDKFDEIAKERGFDNAEEFLNDLLSDREEPASSVGDESEEGPDPD